MSKTIDTDEGLPIQLARWLKAQREDIAHHAAYMVTKRAKEDEELLDYLNLLFLQWNDLKKYEQQMLKNLFTWKESNRNFTTKQRGVITNFYLKHREKFG